MLVIYLYYMLKKKVKCMNDKELFRYLQEIKVILNDLKYNDYEDTISILEERLYYTEKLYNAYLSEYKKINLKSKLLNVITLGYYMRQNGSEVRLQQLLLEQAINTYDDRCYDNEIKIIGLRDEIEKNENLIKCYSKNFEQISSYFEVI